MSGPNGDSETATHHDERDKRHLIRDDVCRQGPGMHGTPGTPGTSSLPFRHCPVVIEPLLMSFILLSYQLAVLVPEYVLQWEMKRRAGTDNVTRHKADCTENHTLEENPYTGNLSLASSATSYFELERTLVVTLPAIPAILFLGPFSDKAGRKYAIIPPIVGQTLAILSCTLTVSLDWPVQVILVGFLVYGFCGQWTTFYSGCFSYIADITKKEQRSFRLVMAMLSMSVSTIVSTASSGYLVDLLGFFWIFFSMFIFNLLILLYALLLVPETIKHNPSVHFFKISHMKKAFTVILADDGTNRCRLKVLVLVAVCVERFTSGSGIDTLFTMNRPLCWGPDLVGVYTSVRHAVSTLGSGLTALVLKSRVRDAWFCLLAVVSDTAANFFRFFVTTTAMMFGSTVIDFANPFFYATAMSILSKLVRDDEIGAVMSSASLSVVFVVLGHFVVNPLYSVTELSGHSSAVYLYMASCYLICTVIMGIYTYITRATMEETKDS